MKDLPYYDLDYCKYGFGIRKRTRIWTNLEGFEPLKCRGDCGRVVDGKHLNFSYMNIPGQNRLDLRHTIPEKLLLGLFDDACKKM